MSTCNLDITLLLILISMGAVYFITLMIIALVRISFVLKLEYLNIPFSTDDLKFTLDMILLTVAIFERPVVMNIPSIFI